MGWFAGKYASVVAYREDEGVAPLAAPEFPMASAFKGVTVCMQSSLKFRKNPSNLSAIIRITLL
jgi:hypothetical protein